MTSRPKLKTREKPAGPRKSAIARLVQPAQRDIDDDAEDKQRGGVQSLGRAFAILEEVARHREGIGLADLSKLVGLHNSTTFHLAKTMVSLGYMRQEKDSKALPRRPAAVCAGRKRARRNRDGQCRDPGAGGSVAGNRRKRPFRGANGRRRGGDRPHQRPRRVSTDRPRRRGAAGALHRARQDHPGLAAPGSAQALPRTRRAETVDQEVDHQRCGAAA